MEELPNLVLLLLAPGLPRGCGLLVPSLRFFFRLQPLAGLTS